MYKIWYLFLNITIAFRNLLKILVNTAYAGFLKGEINKKLSNVL